MESETQYMIPVISFSRKTLKPGSESWKSACERVRRGFEQYGCFEVVYDDFPGELDGLIFGAAKELFDLPLETKMKKASRKQSSFGYMPQNPMLPRYEAMGIPCAYSLREAQRFTNDMWPQGNVKFSEVVHSYATRMDEMYEMAIKMMLESYGVERLFDIFMESKLHNLRFVKYSEGKSSEKRSTGLVEHTDSNFMTILHQYQVEGLQIKTKDGLWINIKPSPSSFLVIAGDGVMAWSNARLRPCEHRVIVDETKERYSVGDFIVMKEILNIPEEFVDDDHPLIYKPFNNIEYFDFEAPVQEETRNFAARLKAFCGV